MSEDTTSKQLTLFAGDSRASRTVLPGSARRVRMSATCGESSPVSFARLDPDGSWLKTYQGCYQVRLDGSLEEFSGTWPRAGMMQSGIAYQRRRLAPHIVETGYSLWPTPTASDWITRRFGIGSLVRRYCRKRPLGELRMGPRLGEVLAGEFGCYQSSSLTEWLMGFPPKWTDLDVSETPSSRKSRSSSES